MCFMFAFLLLVRCGLIKTSEFICIAAEFLTHRDSRFRCLRTAHGTLYFVDNRRLFSMNGPCAVWK